jgi:hypothetical protein
MKKVLVVGVAIAAAFLLSGITAAYFADDIFNYVVLKEVDRFPTMPKSVVLILLGISLVGLVGIKRRKPRKK